MLRQAIALTIALGSSGAALAIPFNCTVHTKRGSGAYQRVGSFPADSRDTTSNLGISLGNGLYAGCSGQSYGPMNLWNLTCAFQSTAGGTARNLSTAMAHEAARYVGVQHNTANDRFVIQCTR